VRKNDVTGKCGACRHPDRTRIEMLCAAGQSFTAVARRFGLSKDVVNRHYAKHVTDERKAVMIAGTGRLEELRQRAEDESASLLDNLRYVRAGLFKMFDAAVECGDKYGAGVIADKLMGSFRDIGRLTGEIAKLGGSSITINNNTAIFASPEWRDAAHAIVAALRNHPEARVAVVSALRALEERRAPALPAPPSRAPTVINAEVIRAE